MLLYRSYFLKVLKLVISNFRRIFIILFNDWVNRICKIVYNYLYLFFFIFIVVFLIIFFLDGVTVNCEIY